MIRIDPDTCYATNAQGEDAIYDMTETDRNRQQRCLEGHNLDKPNCDLITIAERKGAQSMLTRMIASTDNYGKIAQDLLNVVGKKLQSLYKHDAVLILKGSTAMRVMVERILNNAPESMHIPDSLHDAFDKFLVQSDYDTTIVLSNRISKSADQYDATIKTIYEFMYTAIADFIDDDIDKYDIDEMLKPIEGGIEVDPDLVAIPKRRADLHVDGEVRNLKQFYTRRITATNVHIWRRRGYYVMHNPTKTLMSQQQTQVFLSPDFNKVYDLKYTDTKYIVLQQPLQRLRDHSVTVTSLHFEGVVVAAKLTESRAHRDSVQIRLIDHVVDGIFANSVQVHDAATGHTLNNVTKVVAYRLDGNDTVLDMYVHIVDRQVMGFRKIKVATKRQLPLMVSLQHVIDVPSIGANFGLLRVTVPLRVYKNTDGRVSKGWSKAEIVDVSVANHIDASREDTQNHFQGHDRDDWTTHLCFPRGCMNAASLRYQEHDLAIMNKELDTNGTDPKHTKRVVREKMLVELRTILNIDVDGPSRERVIEDLVDDLVKYFGDLIPAADLRNVHIEVLTMMRFAFSGVHDDADWQTAVNGISNTNRKLLFEMVDPNNNNNTRGTYQASNVIRSIHAMTLQSNGLVKIPPFLTYLSETYALF